MPSEDPSELDTTQARDLFDAQTRGADDGAPASDASTSESESGSPDDAGAGVNADRDAGDSAGSDDGSASGDDSNEDRESNSDLDDGSDTTPADTPTDPGQENDPSADQLALADAGSDADRNAGDGGVGDTCTQCDRADAGDAPKPGTLIVTVKDDTGVVIPNAKVTITGASGGDGTSKADGTAKFENLTPGPYDTNASKDGYLFVNASKNVNVPAGGVANGQVTLQKIQVEIEVNNTPAVNDDVVQLKCTVPDHRHKVPCRVRLKKAAPSDVVVTLTNPDARLRFPESGDTTKTVTLPANAGWVAFEISGETASGAIGDALIEAHQNTAGGVLVGSQPATVFWFDGAKIDITVGGNYAITGAKWTVPGVARGVKYSAEATIKPAGVDCTVPQIKDLRIGIMQNGLAGVTRNRTWGNPAITWNPHLPDGNPIPNGTQVVVSAVIEAKITRPATGNDATALVTPLYDQPGKAGATGTLDANSLNPPKGCAGGAASTSFDTPSGFIPTPLTIPGTDAAGTVVGQVTYQQTSAKLTPSFITWAVVFNKSDNKFCCLRQRGWSVNTDATAAGAQSASPDAADMAAVTNPVLAPFCNDQSNDPANATQGPVGAATKTFTK